MPPKKKVRAGPSRPIIAATPIDHESPNPAAGDPVMFDGWTDEQETTLFKAIAVYRLKPAGMHKHFRMVGISELMKNHGVSDTHTNVEGIWRKLNSLYNLEGLDEREDMEEDGSPEPIIDFSLPEEEYGALMSARRFDPQSMDSPMHSFSSHTIKSKRGGRIKSPSPEDSRSGRTVSAMEDETEDESSRISSSPIPPRSKKATPKPRAKAAAAKPRRTAPTRKPKPSPVPTKRKATKNPAGSTGKSTPVPKESSEVPGDDQDSKSELSDAPPASDDDDVGTIATTDIGDGEERAEEAESEVESRVATASPAPTVGKKPGKPKATSGRGKGVKARKGARSDVRRSSRRK